MTGANFVVISWHRVLKAVIVPNVAMNGLNFINIKFWPIGRCVGTVVNARHINEVQPHFAAGGIAVLSVVVNIAVIDLTNSVGVSMKFIIRGNKTHMIVVALTPQDPAGILR